MKERIRFWGPESSRKRIQEEQETLHLCPCGCRRNTRGLECHSALLLQTETKSMGFSGPPTRIPQSQWGQYEIK